MKNLLLSFVLGVCLFSGVYFINQPPKAWADVASLPSQKPVAGDLIDWWHNGSQYQTNWTQFAQFAVQSVNWIAIGFVNPTGSTSGVVNWTLPNAYAGG